MNDFISSPRVAELALLLLLAEALVLWQLHRRGRAGFAPAALWPMLVAGACLLLALRAALAGAAWSWLALWLSLALLAHLFDLRRRWQRAGEA